ELKPERLCDAGSDVLDRTDRHRAQREWNAGRVRRAAGEDFTVAVLHAEQPDRRQNKRQRSRLAEDGGGEVALRDIDQDALAEFDALEVLAVGAQRLLAVRAAVGIVEERLRHLRSEERRV